MKKTRRTGFTLIELLVVLVLVAIASSVASLALRDPSATKLEQEASRLVALLEAARTEARSSGLQARWVPHTAQIGEEGFRFIGFSPESELPGRWLTEGVMAEVVGARAVVLGPEPLIGAQRIVLRLGDQQMTLATDGLGPFAVASDGAQATP